MRFVNDLCTDSIESIILFVNGDHTDELYSNRGRTYVLNARNEHGIYIRHCQESNSQPVPSQAGADTTRPQFSLTMPAPCRALCALYPLSDSRPV